MGESPINLITTPAQNINSNATRRVGTIVLYDIRVFKRIGEKVVITNFYKHGNRNCLNYTKINLPGTTTNSIL